MASIRDVAKIAGVSVSTVSHVINRTRFVREDTEAKVLAAMKELNYKPNRLASSLRRKDKRTNTMGLLIPDSTNPFFSEVLRGVEDACFEAGFSVFLCNSDNDLEKENNYINVLISKQIDGIILVSAGTDGDSLTTLKNNQVPFVLVDREVSGADNDSVLVDNKAGGYQATKYLIELGHKRIGCIGGPSLLNPSATRVDGYRQALSEHGLLDEDLIFRGDFRPQSGTEAAAAMFALDNPPTAIFACNDMMALGALHAADEANFNVPKDISIVGYDDIPLAPYTKPQLTTIAQPGHAMGLDAAKMIISRIEKSDLPPRQKILSTSLIVRNSCQHRED